ncbi:hypothetical protein GCM10009679_33570 [Saccharothrix algeriensis]|uniref:Uncharacterized protein n=1 Tax=Catellatospora bangladeshensis TaxID=310355 RepID=A0A8J3NJY5_9ACTN|nr:hypothetical protein Cba03nite_22790 [Catellatospora bangladeshensis]
MRTVAYRSVTGEGEGSADVVGRFGLPRASHFAVRGPPWGDTPMARDGSAAVGMRPLADLGVIDTSKYRPTVGFPVGSEAGE